MTQSEQQEPTRKEIASKWKSQREEYSRIIHEREIEHSNQLEQELRRASKRVKRHDSDYLVITHTPDKRLKLIISSVIAIIIGVIGIIGVINYDSGLFSFLDIENTEYLIEASQFFSPLFVVISVIWGLHSILLLFNDKIIIDNNAKNVFISKLLYGLIPWHKNVPYSAIKRITWNYRSAAIQYEKGKWIISIDNKENRIDIISGKKETEMSDLAIGICKFIGKELKIESNKPELPTPTFDAKRLPTDWKL